MRGRRLIEALVSLDRAATDVCEDLYLWCFDRTGISLANAYTVLMLTLPLTRILLRQNTWLEMAPIIVLSVSVGRIVGYGQGRMSRQAWNSCVELLRNASWRQVGFSLFTLVLLAVVCSLALQRRADAFYLFLVRLRERQPPRKKAGEAALNQA
jgi:hypothetical protein